MVKFLSPPAALSAATPTTLVPGTSGAAGSGVTAARSDHAHEMTLESYMSLVAEDLTERSIVADASATALVTFSGLTIPASVPLLLQWSYRKNNAAAQSVEYGLMLNATLVMPTGSGAGAWSGVTSATEHGFGEMIIPPRTTDYLQGIIGIGRWSQAGQFSTSGRSTRSSTNAPTVDITDVILRAKNSGATISSFVNNVRLYALPSA